MCGHPEYYCVNDTNSQLGYRCDKMNPYNIESARRACVLFGSDWKVVKEGSGSLVCSKGNTGVGANCNSCDTWRVVVWKDGSPDPHYDSKTYSTFAGYYYGGHDPCSTEDTLGQGYLWNEPCA